MENGSTDKAGVSVLERLLFDAESELTAVEHEEQELSRRLSGLQSKKSELQTVCAFLRRKSETAKQPQQDGFISESDEFAGQPIRECVARLLKESPGMRLGEITTALLRRGYQTTAQRENFPSAVLQALKRAADVNLIERRGKQWFLADKAE